MSAEVPLQTMPALDGATLWQRVERVAEVGNRFGGTPGEERCRNLLLTEFNATGLASVRAEPFPFLAYEPESTTCTVLGEDVVIPSVALQYSSTGIAEGEAVYLGACQADDVAAAEERGVDLRGKVVLAQGSFPWLVAPALAEKGIVALVNIGDTRDELLGHFPMAFYPYGLEAPWEGRVQPMVGVTIEPQAARRLLSLLSFGSVTLRVEHQGQYVEKTSANVIGEIPGSELPKERVVVGAHYDTQAEGPGAADNSTGVATVLELAERWRRLEPRRTIVFCAFGIEELAAWGSYHYCKAHADELELTRGMVNLDALGLPAPGTRVLVADDEMLPYASESATLTGYEAEGTLDASLYAWGDHNPFIDAGVPAVWIWRYPPQHPYYHTSGDVLRYVDSDRTLDVATASAYLTYRLANEAELPLGRSRPTQRFVDLRPSGDRA